MRSRYFFSDTLSHMFRPSYWNVVNFHKNVFDKLNNISSNFEEDSSFWKEKLEDFQNDMKKTEGTMKKKNKLHEIKKNKTIFYES